MNAINCVADVIAEQIIKLLSAECASASFNKTTQGIVTESLGNGAYSVKIEGAVFTVPSSTSDTYNVNDKVLVTFVQNDAKRKYIIGKA